MLCFSMRSPHSSRRPGSRILDVLEDNDTDAEMRRKAERAAQVHAKPVPAGQPMTKAEMRRLAEWAAAQAGRSEN